MQSAIVITKGSDANHIGVAWRDAAGKTTAAEDRPLIINGKPGSPADLGKLFTAATNESKLEAVGGSLWECISQSNAGANLAPPNPTHYGIDLTDAPTEWRGLPWETLYDGSCLGQQVETPLLRFHQPTTAPQPITGWPYRFLIISGEPLTNKDIQVQAEIEAIEDGLWHRRREIITQTLIQPTKDMVCEALQKFQPHVLHYIGHADGSALTIANPANDGTIWHFTSKLMLNWLSKGKSPTPHLVFLNACHTQTERSGQNSASLAQTFLGIGVPAVVGLSDEVEGEASRLLAREFYHHWLGGDDMATAITHARQRIANSRELSGKPRQSHLPCLTICRELSDLMTWPQPTPAVRQLLSDLELDELHRKFVDRNERRAAIFDHWLKPDAERVDPPGSADVLLVHGQGLSGKSDVMRMVLKAMLARGWIARRHEVSGNWLQLLRCLADGDGTGRALSQGLPGSSFDAFRDFTPKLDVLADQVESFKRWRQGLDELLKAKTPVALVLDTLQLPIAPESGTAPLPEWLRLFGTHCLKEVLERKVEGPLLIVLVLKDDELKTHQVAINTLVNKTLTAIPIGFFGPPDEAERAIRQYFRQRWAELESKHKHEFTPDVFQELQEVRDAMEKGLLRSPGKLLGSHLHQRFEVVLRAVQVNK